jgi:hypothetical protein
LFLDIIGVDIVVTYHSVRYRIARQIVVIVEGNIDSLESDSIRSTIPNGIATHLKIKEGDELVWPLEIVKNEIVAVVRKVG